MRSRHTGMLETKWWVNLVDADAPAPTDRAALTILTVTTRPSFRAEFEAGDGGKTACYMTR